jgi:segregation and condensation protein A
MSDLPVVQLEEFEGPFDLVLELVRAKKIDILSVNLGEITDAFLKIIEDQHKITPEQQADFAIVAATLALMKLRLLLPEIEEEDQDEAELSWRIRVYSLYRAQAQKMREIWGNKPLLPGPTRLCLQKTDLWPKVTAEELEARMRTFCQHLPAPLNKRKHLRPQGKKVQQCILILRKYLMENEMVKFHDVVKSENRQTVAVSLLAALEMIKKRQVNCWQSELFGEIEIRAVESK